MTSEQSDRKSEMLLVGRVVGTFGWAGEVKVSPETDFPERFKELEEIFAEPAGKKRRRLHIQRVQLTSKGVRLKFVEYDSKEEAGELMGALLFIPREKAMPLPEGHFYIHDIIGLKVRTTEGEDLGEIEAVARGPANDVYETEKAYIPAVKEAVKEIDLEGGVMVVEKEGIVER